VSINSQSWGTGNGKAVDLYTLTNHRGMRISISNYGGVVQSIWVPDRDGRLANIAFGFASLAGYIADGETHAGAIVGRYANRIADGRFTLDGVTHHLVRNEGANTLHGGPMGFNTKVWAASAGETELTLSYTDPDGTNGFPGELAVAVTYALTADNELRIHYSATTSKPTVVNLTNHTYFNLAGAGSGDIFGQLLRIDAERYTPVDQNLIPTSEVAPLAGTPLDFIHPKPIGRDIPAGGYDHNFVLNGTGMRAAAFAEDSASGRTLTAHTDQPGIQFYSGGHVQGFALETQHFPDSPNQPDFPSTELRPGETFSSTTVYRFGVAR
jgi:aldose 1-epimerase